MLAVVAALTAIAKNADPTRKAVLLGSASGIVFGLQASLTQPAVHVLSDHGLVPLLMTWQGYASAATALVGMLLLQSAFEVAPLPASYPAVVTTELITGVAVGVLILGGTLRLGTPAVAAAAVSLLVMICGIYLLTTSPLVTGQLDRLARRQDIGLATHLEARLAQELRWAERAAQRLTHTPPQGTVRLRREMRRIDDGIQRLRQLQHDIRRHRDAQEQRLHALPVEHRRERAASVGALRERELAIDEHAQRLRARAQALATNRQVVHDSETTTHDSEVTQMTTTEQTPPVTIAEQLVGALTSAWRAIKDRHAAVPDVVLTVGSGTIGVKPGQARFGHFAAARWQRGDEALVLPEPPLRVPAAGR